MTQTQCRSGVAATVTIINDGVRCCHPYRRTAVAIQRRDAFSRTGRVPVAAAEDGDDGRSGRGSDGSVTVLEHCCAPVMMMPRLDIRLGQSGNRRELGGRRRGVNATGGGRD